MKKPGIAVIFNPSKLHAYICTQNFKWIMQKHLSHFTVMNKGMMEKADKLSYMTISGQC